MTLVSSPGVRMGKTMKKRAGLKASPQIASAIPLKDLKPDPQNARRHTGRNIGMIERSLHHHGAGRSILLDENNRIIAGHAVVEAAQAAGFERVIPIESDGKDVIAVVRTGLTEEQKQELALADNRATELSTWDGEMLQALGKEIDLGQFFKTGELKDFFQEAGSPAREDRYPEMDLQPFEHYDYLVLFFRNSMDFLKACDKFGVQKVAVKAGKDGKTKIGLGRCLDGARLLEMVCRSKS